METDTVIGIAGATLLVAVLVGVFAYQWESQPEDEEPTFATDAQNRTAFETIYGFNATADFDNDGIPNYLDDDIDNDDLPNSEDNETAWAWVLNDQTLAAQVPGSTVAYGSEAFAIGPGASHVHVTASYDTNAPSPLGSLGDAETIEFSMSAEAGNILSGETTPPTAPGTTMSYVGVADDPASGTYSFSATHSQPVASAKSIDIVITVEYGRS